MLIAVLKLALGIVLLAFGASRFIDATMALAKRFNVSPLLVGVVLIGFGTSVPEMIVSSTAAFKGTINIAIGNAIGSNTANIGLVLGLTGLLRSLKLQPALLTREFSLLWIVTLVVGLFLWNHHLARWEGVLLIAMLFAYLALVIWLSRRLPLLHELIEISVSMEKLSIIFVCLWWIVGLVLVLLGAEFMVSGAMTIAHYWHVSDLVIGLTIVAVGTSLPELAASITSALKGHDALVFGNVIGSNVFNTLAVIGVPALIAPGYLPSELFRRDYIVMIFFTALLWVFAWMRRRSLTFTRWQSGLLLAGYVGYTLFLFWG
ncbi:MAG: hypothetical protein A3F17_08430 [Gammaproteobacteria bacterium RIFCSPHIGHO2_12_FULL_41_15]|nr:MAG: hypothetical protein A3F17_08430 [Gammaproteobacteria bacterium RIFCSPHIGHO2_12_FULL_41_15]